MSKPEISLFFPVYKDEKTIENVVQKAIKLLDDIASNYEIIIVNDGSPDDSKLVAEKICSKNSNVKLINHETNKGYGAALKTGFSAAKYEWICQTDGDDEYEVEDFRRLMNLRNHFPLIVTFRYARMYSSKRIFISRIYNLILSFLFKTKFRDISTGLRVINKNLLEEIDIKSTSPFIGAEIAIKSMLKGYPVGEVGIQTFPREIGTGSSTSWKNIKATIMDMLLVRNEIFSAYYDLPINRNRNGK